MKKNFLLLLIPLLFIGGISISLTSCSDDEDDFICESTVIGGATIQACCNEEGTQCYYEYKGKQYDCNGIDCTEAATELAADIIAGGKSTELSKETILMQILELRDNAMNCPCHKK